MQYQNNLLGKPITTHTMYGKERYAKYCKSIAILRKRGGREVLPFGESRKEIDELQRQQTNTTTIKARHTADANGSYIIEREQLSQKKRNIAISDAWHSKFNSDVCPTLLSRDYKDPKIVIENIEEPKLTELTSDKPQGQRVYDSTGLSCTLSSQGGGMGAKTGPYAFPIVHNLQPRSPNRPSLIKNPKSGGSGHLQKQDGTTYCLYTGNTQAVEICGGLQEHQTPRTDGNSPSLTSAMGMGGGQIPIINKIRRLTPRETYRLQGFCPRLSDGKFDDTFYEKAKTVVSSTQLYKTAGNAVTVAVVKEILNQIKTHNDAV